MAGMIPAELGGKSYISLTTFRKTGVPVPTPVWFGEGDGVLYVMARPDSGKCKRVRNNSRVKVAPCTVRGKVTGAEIDATARILAPQEFAAARAAIRRKYWLARISFLWSKQNVYLEIKFS
jgi:PPOX class probable F420-dependent enzyme